MNASISESLVALSDEQRVFLLLGVLLDRDHVKDLMACDGRSSHGLLPLVDKMLGLQSDVRIPLCLTLLRESLHAIENANVLTS